MDLDAVIKRPKEMEDYLAHYGWHFNKKMCDYAVSLMKVKNPSSGKEEAVEAMRRDEVLELLKRYNIKLENDTMYDSTFVANMCKADYMKKSISDDQHMAMYIQDTIDDVDAADGSVMYCWYAKMRKAGKPIEWEDML